MWQVRMMRGHTERVIRLQFSDDGAQAISGSDDDMVKGFFMRHWHGCILGW